MDEIKPVGGALLVDGRVVLVDENYPAQRKEGASLYSQQAIDTLRAEVERLRKLISTPEHGLSAEANAQFSRGERAEAEADDLRTDAERYRWLRLALLGAENDPIDHLLLEKEPETDTEFDSAVDAAIDAAKQDTE